MLSNYVGRHWHGFTYRVVLLSDWHLAHNLFPAPQLSNSLEHFKQLRKVVVAGCFLYLF